MGSIQGRRWKKVPPTYQFFPCSFYKRKNFSPPICEQQRKVVYWIGLTWWRQFVLCCSSRYLNMLNTVWFIHSTKPLLCRWYGVVRNFLILQGVDCLENDLFFDSLLMSLNVFLFVTSCSMKPLYSLSATILLLLFAFG